MNINQLDELKVALTIMEGSGISSCWNDERESATLNLTNAIAKYNEIPDSLRDEYEGWYECIYGNGGWHRYFVNMKTGEVTFSAFHSRKERIEQAVALGFKLH